MSEKAIERIRKLLKIKRGHEAIAADASKGESVQYASANEAANAATLIQELLAAHKLALTDVEREAEEATNPFVQEALYPTDYGAELVRERVKWAEDLGNCIGYAYYCQLLGSTASNLLFFVGRREDVEIAKIMFLRLARTALYLMQKDRREAFDLRRMSPMQLTAYLLSPQGESTDETYAASYLTGFVRAVGSRIIQTRSRLEIEAGESQALIRAERDVALYADKVAQGRHEEELPTPDLDYTALLQGMIRGRTVDLDEAGGKPALNPKEET